MNKQTTFDAESAEKVESAQRSPEKNTLTRTVSADFIFAFSGISAISALKAVSAEAI